MPEKTFVPCPKCGADLPPEASFCPYCTESFNPRTELRPPRRAWGRVLRRALLALVLLSAGVGLYLAGLPRVYEGVGEVVYTDNDGTYQVLMAWSDNRYEPIHQLSQRAEVGEQYRFPVRLYINHMDNGDDAGQFFLQKVDQVTVGFLPLEDEGAATLSCTEPAPNSSYAPGAALVTYVDFVAQRDFTGQLEWTFAMANGDVLHLRTELVVTSIPTYHYYPEDVPMNTTDELQALVDQVSATVEEDAVVYFHLPPVTYEGGLVLEDRPINLYGSTEGDRRTTFTDTLRVAGQGSWITYVEDIDFVGQGDKVGISASARLWVESCTLTGWKTAVLGYGDAWVNTIACRIQDNGVGLYFNSEGNSASHTRFNDNQFLNNGTAVILDRVPTEITLDFEGCLFSGNTVDIDNRCQQPIDISQAVFE